jgi:aspartyl-tRNA(Asn)/glutamyl-tRNA(Gln) amidotransferase subunit B
LVIDGEFADYYESALAALRQKDDKGPKLLANWITSELFGAMNRDNITITDSKVKPVGIAELVDLITAGTISGRTAKDVFLEMWESGKNATAIVKEKGLEQVSDDTAIRACIEQIMQQNAGMVEEYRSGKDKLFGFFVGQVMKAMQGKANPQLLNDVLKEKLNGS